ncbi:MAG: carboxy terminal-processing peptidase [Opitutales bacterium]
MKKFNKIKITTLLTIISLGFLSANAEVSPTLTQETSPKMRAENELLVKYMEQVHFDKVNIQDLDVRQFIREFMSNLDFMRLFFLAEDVQQYQDQYTPIVDRLLHQGTLLPALVIYDRFLLRTRERVAWIKNRLEKPIDLEKEGTFTPNRKDMDWPESPAEADELWENRLLFDIQNILLTYENNEKKEDDIAKGKKTSKKSKKAITEEESTKGMTFEEKFAKAKVDVLKRYEKILENAEKSDAIEVQEIYLNSLCSMFDPHSSFLSEYQLEEFDIAVRNALVGIGAVLQDKDGYCVINELVAGGPAKKSKKIKTDDKIVAVGNENGEMVDVVGMKLRNIVKMIRGDKNTEVRLRIEPSADPSSTYEIVLIRDEIKLTTNLAKASLFEIPNKDGKLTKIGLIDLPAFYGEKNSPDEAKGFSITKNVEELLNKLKGKGVEGIILDMRHNGGGFLPEAVDLAGLFIEQGPVVQIKDTRGKTVVLSDEDKKVVWDGPLIVMVSRLSASAAEIVAGALQDHKRALIIGDKTTHGKGTVQGVYEFKNNNPQLKGASKVTVQKWYRPNGNSIQIKGVNSDIIFPSAYDEMEIGEINKENALKWDAIDPTNLGTQYFYSINEKNEDLITTLANQSKERQNSLEEFAFYLERIDWVNQKQQQKVFSLSYADRKEQVAKDENFLESYEEREKTYIENLNYSFEEILLDSAIEEKNKQEQEKLEAKAEEEKAKLADDDKSTEADSEEPTKISTDEDEDEDIPVFDVQLRETIRIMKDILNYQSEVASKN